MDVGRSAPEAGGIVDLQRLSGPVTLDGFIDEAAWEGIEPLNLTMYQPVFRGESGREIQVLVGYDDEALYVAARFYHDDPSDIRAFSLTRDTWSGDDGFGLFLDTFNDNENAVRFVGMPLGTRMDMSITGDGQNFNTGSAGPRGISWNTFWDLETQITEEGWYGEMRVPFESLRFETADDGSVVMGMMVYAYEPGEEQRWTFPAIPPTKTYTQVSAFQDVRFQGLQARSPVLVSPYALASANRAAELNPTEELWLTPESRSWEVGGEVKLNPTRNLTLDLTVNTDFAAVEADQQQVNLTRFSLFFDEKRPFFQERAGIFDFATGTERGTLFYSRRIGLAEGEPVRIYGGARMVGRLGGWDLGFIDMQTEEYDATPSENFGVLRLRRRVLNPNSFVGAMTTSRIGVGGLYNVTYGLDGLLRVVGDEYLTVKWLQTFQGGNPDRDAAPTGLDAGRFYVDWTRRNFQGLNYQHAIVWSGPGYAPEMGFEPRQDFTRLQSDWNYRWVPGEASAFRLVWAGVTSLAYQRHLDDAWETLQVSPFLQLETKPGATFKVSATTSYEDVLADFDLSDDTMVPAGSYWATEGAVEFRAPRGWAIRPNLTVRGGEFFDGNRFGVETSFNWPMSRYLELEGGWEWNRINFEDRNELFHAHLMRVSAQAAANTRLSLNAFVQYNSLTGGLSTNARFRYQFREGQDLWFVWNEGLNLDRDVVGLPRLPLEDARTLTVKYTHTFIF
ncbi:MAG: DUF5916 domain-containing protein [Gemmatimonadota bacterium]